MSFIHSKNLMEKCNYYVHSIDEETETWKEETSKGACAFKDTWQVSSGFGTWKNLAPTLILLFFLKKSERVNVGPEVCVWLWVVRHIHKCLYPGTMLPFSFPLGRLVEGKGLWPTKMMHEARMGFSRPFPRRITEGQHTEVYVKNRSSE